MTQNTLSKIIRVTLFVIGVIGLAETLGFFFLQPWATSLIPWELNRLAGIFLSSIFAASSFPILWIAFSQEYAALTGGGINYAVLLTGFAGFSFQTYAANPRQPVLIFGLVCAAGALGSAALAWYGSRHKFQHGAPVPALARISLAVFALNLLIAGSQLTLKRPHVFPWQLTPQQSVLYGWIFLGAAVYFFHGVLRPVWGNAYGQLLGFLAYDLVLIVPFVALFFGSEPFLVPNLLYYIIVLVYSGGLALYYLWINPQTRISFKSVAVDG